TDPLRPGHTERPHQRSCRAAPHPCRQFSNRVIGLLKTLGAVNIAKTTRAIRDQPERALPLLGITNNPDAQGT
ncbi:hypothetical protein ABZ701_38060, partial [Streptomyces sp. NPDC006996]